MVVAESVSAESSNGQRPNRPLGRRRRSAKFLSAAHRSSAGRGVRLAEVCAGCHAARQQVDCIDSSPAPEHRSSGFGDSVCAQLLAATMRGATVMGC